MENNIMDYVPFPKFSSEYLSVWFAQMEATFALNGVSSDADKYDYILTQVPSDVLAMIEDFILEPPTVNKYDQIKSEFIKRMTIHKMKKVEFAHAKPSEYLRKLRAIGNRRVPDEIIINIWQNNLPEKVREVVSLENFGNVNSLCEMADKVMAIVTSTPPTEVIGGKQFEMIMRRLEDLGKQVELVQLMIDDQDCEDEEQQKKGLRTDPVNTPKETFNLLNRNATSSPKIICWYHRVFGDNAIACIAPCQYKFSPTQYFLRK